MFTLTIETDNKPHWPSTASEIAVLLRITANEIERGETSFSLIDLGNEVVGRAELT